MLMKNQQPVNSSPTYLGGWHIALRNYNVVEIESINQLVGDVNKQKQSNLGRLHKNHFTTNLDDMPLA